MRSAGDFQARLSAPTTHGCMEWAGARNKAGYGNIYWHGRYTNAHRVALELATGTAARLQVLHRCDNPPCCNPDHLYEGTQAQNLADAVSRGRAWNGANTPCGELSPHARLRWADVDRMRALYASGGWTHRTLAREFGVNRGHIGRILNGEKWRSRAEVSV